MWRVALFAVLFVLAGEVRAWAASCCGSVLALGDRLGPGEGMSLQLGVLGQNQLGWFDGHRRFRADGAESRSLDGRFGASLAKRLTGQWQAMASLGWMEGYRTEGKASSMGGFLADSTLAARYEPEKWERWAFTGTLTLPTGRTVGESTTPLVADATGRGMFGFRVAAAFEHPIESWFVLTQLGVEALSPHRDGMTRAGVAGDLLVLTGYTFMNAAALSAGLRTTLTSYLGPERFAAPTQTTSAVISGGYPFARRWTVSGSIAIDPPVPGISSETLSRVSVSVGVRTVLQKL
jgi:hypothetical protein